MTLVDEHLERILGRQEPLPPIEVNLLDATGCYAARDVTARASDAASALLLPSGALVTTRLLARLAAAGVSAVAVAPRPRVVLLGVGDPSSYEVNATSLLLASACQEAGAVVYRTVTSTTDLRTLRELIEDQLVRADVILALTADDAAEGLLASALEEISDVAPVDVAMTPGGRHRFGHVAESGTPVFVLSEGTIDAYTVFEVFIRPFLRVLAADPVPFRRTVRARASLAWTSPADEIEFRFGRVVIVKRSFVFTPVPLVEPMAMLAECTAMAIVPPGERVRTNGPVTVVPLEDVPQ